MDVSGIETILLSIHTGLAAVTKIPELLLAPDEATALAKTTANVARHYEVGGVSQKYLDWFALITTLGTVYGSRALAYNFRTAMENAGASQPSNMGYANG